MILKLSWVMIMLVSLLSTTFLACEDVKDEIQAEVWLIDNETPEDTGLFRTINDPSCGDFGESCEEFLPITEPAIKEFMCWHKDDVKKWADRLTKECKKDED